MKRTNFLTNLHISSYLNMINDGWRNKFFRDALYKHAKNKVVLDMGTGTGILAFYALSAGAKFVYCIEKSTAMCMLVEKILSKNFDRSRFKILNCNLWTDEINEKIEHKINVLVSETVGPGLFDQGMFHTWHCVKSFLDTDAISIPDRLHCDLWIWPYGNYEKFQVTKDLSVNQKLYCWELLDENFVQSLIEVDRETKRFFPSNWVETNQIDQSPLLQYHDVISYTMESGPSLLFSEQHYPRHIIPNISFEIDIPQNCTAAIINKISFEESTLWLKDALYMSWKYSPMFSINDKGRYRFTYNNLDLIHLCDHEWTCELTEEQ